MVAKAKDENTTVDEATGPVAFDPEKLAEKIWAYKFAPTPTFPDGITYEELAAKADSKKKHPLDKIIAVMTTGLVGLLHGRPGVGKTALINMIRDIIAAELIYVGPNSSPDKYVIPGLGRRETPEGTYEFLAYIAEAALASDNHKIILADELARLQPSVAQQTLELFGPKPRISGNDITNVVGRFATANRVEDGMDPLDPALATRVVTIEIDPETTGWQYHVSTMFDVDLTAAFEFHQKLDPVVRHQVVPRKVVKIIRNLLATGCGWPALMLRHGTYEVFTDATGRDVTAEVLDGFAKALGTPNRDKLSDPMDTVLGNVVKYGDGAYIEGPPGIAKTSYTEARIADLDPGADILVISMANACPEDWSQVMIIGDQLKRQLLEFFAKPVVPGVRKYLVLDEIGRAPDDVKDMLLEITQERTCAGIPTGVHGIVALNNTAKVEDLAMDVTPLDTAQADRFMMNLSVTAADVPWETYLLGRYGQNAEHFCEWWKDLSPRDQALYPIRVLESAIKWWLAGMPLADTRPMYDGKPYDISFHELERALADRPLVKIREVASRVDHFETVLSGPNGTQSEEHLAVYDAFDRADISQLREHREVCERLLPHLGQQSKIALLRSAKAKRRFWLSVVNGEAE